MRPGEIASRLRQLVAKQADRFGVLLPSFDTLPTSCLERTGRFFFDDKNIPERIQLIRDNVPGFETDILNQAEQIMNHRFSLLGYDSLNVGASIDWQLDVVNGKQAPLRPWPQINYLDFSEVGDSKITWELSRHQYLVTLAKAWLLTGDARFVRKLEDIFRDWQEKNPYPLGINWASSLEVAFRSLSWIWARELLASCESALRLRQDMTRALALNAWYIRRYLSEYFSPNTHLQGEAVALFFIGTLFPSLPGAADWRKTGWNILREHARTKVLSDGVYFEQSTYYHVYALDFFLHARILSERNSLLFPSDYDDVLKRMLRHLSLLCQAGPPPRFGDDDGGRVFDGRRNQAIHLLDPLAIGAALYRDSLFKQRGTRITEEMLWLLGNEGLRSFSACPTSNSPTSAVFPRAGLFVSHAGRGSRSQVVFDAGPLGGGSGGHGHADSLGLTLNLNEKPLIVDPGTCHYVDSGTDREDFRSTRFHNSVTIDGRSQADPQSPFSWFNWPGVHVEVQAFEPGFQFIRASHDGYERLHPPVTHYRTLFAPCEDFWFVLDQFLTTGSHTYNLHWHLAAGTMVENKIGDNQEIEIHQDERKLHLLTDSNGWHSAIEPGWFSPAYGVKQPAPVICFAKRAQGNEAIATVLWAGTNELAIPVLTRLSQSVDALMYHLTTGDKCSILVFGKGKSDINIEGWESDARFLYGTVDMHKNPSRVILIQASYVRYRGQTLHDFPDKQAHLVWCR